LSVASFIVVLEQTIKKKAWLHLLKSDHHSLKIRNRIIFCV